MASENTKAWIYIHEKAKSVSPQKIALNDGIRTYTYSEMFDEWERYGSVFSALGMTRSARVGIIGSTSVQAIFSLYGLNMVGAQVSVIATYTSFSVEKVVNTVKSEKLTDIILSDDYSQPGMIASLLNMKEELGLNNVLLLHVPMGGDAVNRMVSVSQEYKYMYLKQFFSPICMDLLLEKYGQNGANRYEGESDDVSVILHTSGTTSGTGKPIPLSDMALNNVGSVYSTLLQVYSQLRDDLVCGVTVDMSNSYSFMDQIHAPLAVGATVALVPWCAMNPEFYRAIPEFRISVLFVVPAFVEMWIKNAQFNSLDFSSLRLLVLGGSSVSVAGKRRFFDFISSHGGRDFIILNGYGLTELGGACILSGEDIDDESIGRVMPGVEALVYDEDKDVFCTRDDAPCTGILYLSSDSMSGGILDGKEVVRTEDISGKRYICTNDIVSIDKTGRFTYLGRANRYFINDSGVKYESGRVETEISRQTGIESCCVVPFYLKLIHDNVPMLCVKPVINDLMAAEVVRWALMRVFVIEKTLSDENLPYRVMITDEIPKNQNGKIDTFRIASEEVCGKKYSVNPVRHGKKLIDIHLKPIDEDREDMVSTAFKSMVKDMIENNNRFNKFNTEGFTMNHNFNPYDFFSSMNGQINNCFGAQAYQDYCKRCNEYWANCFERYMGYWKQQSEAFSENAKEVMPDAENIRKFNEIMLDYAKEMHELIRKMAEEVKEQNISLMKSFCELYWEAVKKKAARKSEE